MISATTKTFAVLGDPVEHSLSPVMHNAWFADAGLDAAYVALRAPFETAEAALAGLEAAGVAGANVTVPLKEAAASAFPPGDEIVSMLAAANTLVRADDGLFRAHNTDAEGFVCGLLEAAPTWRERTRTALILGAGGAARSIAFGLARAGVGRILFANRTIARAQEAAARLAGVPVSWDDLPAAFAAADLIVNATTLGMGGGGPDWPIEAAPAHAIVADAVYRPLRTKLLLAAQARGLAAVDGLGMLIHQGALAFRLWFGERPDTRAARARLLSALGETPQ